MTEALEGLLTIAFGRKQFVRMAKALALSYRRLAPKRPFAVVTDSSNKYLLMDYFDKVIVVNPEYGSGVVQKLHADLYSPFNKTLFVDSDCLFYKNPEGVWNIYEGKPFSVRGWRYLTGNSEYERRTPYPWLTDTADFLAKLGLNRLPLFNSGLFYFDRSDTSRALFSIARSIYASRSTLGFIKFKDAPLADEPVFAAAMERCGIEMLPWDPKNGMETAIDMTNPFGINVLHGRSKFLKRGIVCEPAVIHFNINYQDSFIYNREIYRLACDAGRLPPVLANGATLARIAKPSANQVVTSFKTIFG